MPPQTELELRFEREMLDGLPELKRLGYNPTYFIRMMNEMGAARAIRTLIDSPNESEGFTRLWEMGHLELSAEAIVADQSEWAELFTDEQRQKARRRLEQVGYTFQNVATPAGSISLVGTDWTDAECSATVADYFDMLTADLLGQPVNKAEHNRLLRQTITRSAGSIEFKHANISAVLNEMQQPYIEGYKPRGNFQRRLADAVDDYLDRHPDLFTTQQMLAAIEPTIQPAIAAKAADIFVEPPEIILPTPDSTPWLSLRGRRVNFAERDARNRQLGRLGEEFTLSVERRQLIDAGRDDLAGRVEWIADTRGDGVGFDVLSYDAGTESEKWIEVKTTGLGKYHPFMVTANEVRCSEAEPDRFHLYRVFEFKRSPRVFVLPGSLSIRCELRPTSYTAAPRGLNISPT